MRSCLVASAAVAAVAVSTTPSARCTTTTASCTRTGECPPSSYDDQLLPAAVEPRRPAADGHVAGCLARRQDLSHRWDVDADDPGAAALAVLRGQHHAAQVGVLGRRHRLDDRVRVRGDDRPSQHRTDLVPRRRTLDELGRRRDRRGWRPGGPGSGTAPRPARAPQRGRRRARLRRPPSSRSPAPAAPPPTPSSPGCPPGPPVRRPRLAGRTKVRCWAARLRRRWALS